MSNKNNKKSYRNISNYIQSKPAKIEISIKDSISKINTRNKNLPESLKFEIKYFLISLSTLITTSIYIHKSYLNNYNFKLLILISLYFLRKVGIHIYYHFHIRQYLIYKTNYYICILFIVLLLIDILYIFYDLLKNNSIYSLLPLFYFMLLHIPVFIFDNDKRYENSSKEMIRMMKKVLYFSLEVCYYGIFIPVFFAVKNNRFFNPFAIFIYTIIAWINNFLFLFAFNYFKRSAEFYHYTLSTGFWKKINKNEITEEKLSKVKIWASSQHYEKGAIVEYKGKYYVGLSNKNVIEPNNLYMVILYKLFNNPKKLFKGIVIFHAVITIVEYNFYVFTQFNIFSLNLLVTSWYIFYEIYLMYLKIKEIFNKVL